MTLFELKHPETGQRAHVRAPHAVVACEFLATETKDLNWRHASVEVIRETGDQAILLIGPKQTPKKRERTSVNENVVKKRTVISKTA